MKITIFLLLFAVLFAFAACEDENEYGENETKISENFSDESHKTGQNCMECHVNGGRGEGWFTVAGSVYNDQLTDSAPNGIVKLTTEPQAGGNVIVSVEVDEKGNFYTTEPIDFGDGLYATLESQTGTKNYMQSKVLTGACNSCHGSSTDRIRVE
ncbi:MAG TPA: hypothetical protein VKA10_01140 [Prolixibacteraceae bacterium]|nr:hypothetical protein [Prolixibacteraceae bacterium]